MRAETPPAQGGFRNFPRRPNAHHVYFHRHSRHHWKYDEDLCLDAKNRYNGDKLANGNPVQAYTCEKGDNYNQNWKVI